MAEPTRERLLSKRLSAFLLLVAAIVSYALLTRHPTPDLDGAIELLADGDLDGSERQRMLRHTIDLAHSAESSRQRWAGLLAAVALADRDAFQDFDRALGDGTSRVLPEGQRRWLSLGDPLLANLLPAMIAEAEGDVTIAGLEWQQVAAQARMTGNSFAGELARDALRRLR